MITTLRCTVTGRAPYEGVSAKGKPFFVTNVFVKVPSQPFPLEVGVMKKINLPAGDYDVPFTIDVYNNRFQVNLDFDKAVQSAK